MLCVRSRIFVGACTSKWIVFIPQTKRHSSAYLLSTASRKPDAPSRRNTATTEAFLHYQLRREREAANRTHSATLTCTKRPYTRIPSSNSVPALALVRSTPTRPSLQESPILYPLQFRYLSRAKTTASYSSSPRAPKLPLPRRSVVEVGRMHEEDEEDEKLASLPHLHMAAPMAN